MFEHVEIAAYTALSAAAEAAGDEETQRVSELALQQGGAMAKWLTQRLPRTVNKFDTRSVGGRDDAKLWQTVPAGKIWVWRLRSDAPQDLAR
ncbi:DUF892 family protein [Paraburkholderia tropica]|uniref:DUF892 family protein n=1 Tax=Paraburkholderia tropica TaxID=92647 RepID=UPI001F16F16A|nr:DUF892 family protein [Paraburkholderia tropica]